jgi:glycosyltransferase involved in cell wall biosynthesis
MYGSEYGIPSSIFRCIPRDDWMMNRRLRVATVLVGDIHRMPDMRVKYGAFFEALSHRFDIVDTFDASLRGLPRYWNAMLTYHPSVPIWKEHFFKNVSAFKVRSRHAHAHLRRLDPQADVILQIGALLNSGCTEDISPLVIYTDNTTRITGRRRDGGRLALSPRELERWISHERNLYQGASHIAVRADLVRTSLIDEYGVDGERVSVIGGGVNFSPFPGPVSRSHHSPPTVLFIGEGFHRKGGDLLLRAFALARLHVPEARLWIVTRDPVPDGYPLENVEVFPISWDRSVIADYYRRADIFVLPSRLETWGDVLLEAMSFGLPCIGVRGQAMEDIIKHEDTGLLVDQNQTNNLAGALIRLLSQPETCLRMGQSARTLVERQFTWDCVVERLEPVLAAAANRRVQA